MKIKITFVDGQDDLVLDGDMEVEEGYFMITCDERTYYIPFNNVTSVRED